MTIMDPQQIADLPRKYGPVILAVNEAQRESPSCFANRFVVACNQEGHVIARAGAGHLLDRLAELGIAPGYTCPELVLQAQAQPGHELELGPGLRAFGTEMPYNSGIYLLVGQETRPGQPGPEDRVPDPLAGLLARQIGGAARWHREEYDRQLFQTERGKLQAFHDLTSELSELNSPTGILAAVTARLTELLDAGTTIIYGQNPAQTRLVPLAGHQIPPRELTAVRYEISIRDNVMAQVYQSGKIKRIEDLSQMEPGDETRVLGDLGLRSVLLVPIRLPDRPLGVIVAGRYLARPFDASEAEVVAFTAHQIAMTLENARLRSDLVSRLQDVDRELTLAKGLQSLMVPGQPLRVRNVAVAGATWPARQLGGDYFDYFAHKGFLDVIVADIMGKGVSAALLMSILRSHVRTVFRQDPRLTRVAINRLSRMMYQDLKPHRAFATVLVLSLNLKTMQLSLFSAGHHLPLLAGAGGVSDLPAIRTRALGLLDTPLGDESVQQIQLRPGNALLAYTDGVIDAPVREGGERFGANRLKAALAAAFRPPVEAADLLAAIQTHMPRTSMQQPDDMTLCVLNVE